MPNQIINEVINGSGLTINLSIVHLMPAVGSSNKGNGKSRLTYTPSGPIYKSPIAHIVQTKE